MKTAQLKKKKETQIIGQLKDNALLLEVCERSSYLLSKPQPWLLTPDSSKFTIAFNVTNSKLFDEVCEERQATGFCCNLKCANKLANTKKTVASLMMVKPKYQSCCADC